MNHLSRFRFLIYLGIGVSSAVSLWAPSQILAQETESADSNETTSQQAEDEGRQENTESESGKQESSLTEQKQVTEEKPQRAVRKPTTSPRRIYRRVEPETEGTEALGRFQADTVIKSRYKLNGKELEVDPD